MNEGKVSRRVRECGENNFVFRMLRFDQSIYSAQVRGDFRMKGQMKHLARGLLVMIACGVAAAAELEPLVPAPGTAAVMIVGDGADFRVELVAPAVSLIGFEYDPRTRAERETFHLAEQNLKTGDGLVRFNTRASCRLTHVEVDMGSKGVAGRPRNLSANYRFACDRSELLDSAAVGLFVAFPSLGRVFVRYDLAGVRGVDELNRDRQVVSFVPLY